MKTGRNDPCPCGSGKKYKKCCLEKDQQAERAASAAAILAAPRAPALEPLPRAAAPPSPRASPPAEPPDPRIEAINARWEEFEAAEYEGKISLFAQTLADPDLMDGEMAFEMLNTLYAETAKQHERHRFEALVEDLRRELPEVYEDEAKWILPWRIENALTAGAAEAVLEQARELASIADRAIDAMFQAIDQLAYHGQLGVLVEVMPIAWPRLKDSYNVTGWAMERFVQNMVSFLIFDDLERHGAQEGVAPELAQHIRTYSRVRRDWIARYREHLAGRAASLWTLDDFDFQPSLPRSERDESWEDEDEWDDEEDEDENREEEARMEEGDSAPEAEAEDADEVEVSADPGRRNLYYLSVEFLGYLRRAEKVPYTRGELVRARIVEYLLKRFDGDLKPRLSMTDRALHPKKKPPELPPPRHRLAPDAGTLDIYLGSLVNMFTRHPHQAAACFEMIPAWLRFLETRELLDASERERTLAELSNLRGELLELFDRPGEDPALAESLRGWPSTVAPGASGG